MGPAKNPPLKHVQDRLLKIAQVWAQKKKYDQQEAAELRRQAVLINHSHYLENIPAYQKLAQEEDIGELSDIEPIKSELMSTDDIFKSYNQEWLDQRDFARMNEWLGTIFHERIDIDVKSVRTIDDWIDRLTAAGITPAYSSGTTGRFSFVPRCTRSWHLFTNGPAAYLAPILISYGLGSLIQRLLAGPAARLLSPDSFASMAKKMGMPGYDGVFLNFRKGNMGIQLVGQELSHLFDRVHFLYDVDLSASALRCITRGPKNDEDRNLLAGFHAATVGKKEENYENVIQAIERSIKNGQRTFIFGAPYQLKELIDLMDSKNQKLALKPKSVVLFGGGWKTFEGERISRQELVDMISEAMSVPDDMIIEGYSMTEINGLFTRCGHGRFHMPPVIEPVILDQELTPLSGDDVTGAFGFLDPFAVSYPGAVISGDNVRLVTGECECGFHGPALMQIERAPGREVKGCGGIMASVEA